MSPPNQSNASSGAENQLLERVRSWRERDPDPDTVAALDQLTKRADDGDEQALAELADAFAGRLAFGTAGLRGAMGPGPNRMNRVLVTEAAAGLAAYLLDQGLGGGPVLVGYDARHKSHGFACDTAEILSAAGFQVLLTGSPTPTPVVAFGIRHFGCIAGVVVTASHNPPQDNGYKVYLGDGSQIVPPADSEIADRIALAAAGALSDLPRSDAYRVLGDELVQAYLDRIDTLVAADAARDISWVYTPLHGIGAAVVRRVIARTGFARWSIVEEQAEPDPDFPTVPFPNPEEPGALDRAIEQASTGRADLVVANDPDADRCAVAVPTDEAWRMLRGDELGALLADDALRRGVEGTYACSIVSSSLLAEMARRHGQPFAYTLTGFKWIGRVPGLAFGYEEAIGYCVDPAAVPDKDGISALVRVLALAAELNAAGRTLLDQLDEIARTYGVYQTDQLSVRVTDLSVISAAMARLRAEPPTQLAGQPIQVVDLATGSPDLPPTDGVRLVGDAVSVVVRPSGTEPKLKCYLEVRVPTESDSDLAAARAQARDLLAVVRGEVARVLGLG